VAFCPSGILSGGILSRTHKTSHCYVSLWFLQKQFDAYIFQQDSALERRARQTIELLQRETSKFIPPDLRPQNNRDLNLVDCQIMWGVMHDRAYQMPVQDVADIRQRLIDARCTALWTCY